VALLSLAPAGRAQDPGTLTLTGPNGTQTVALKSANPPALSIKLNHARIRRGQSAALTGTVSPAQGGTYVELQQRRGHRWRDLARAELRLSNRFSFTIRGSSKGRYSYRVTITASTATSKTVTLTVT
jgi:hypothetical protein